MGLNFDLKEISTSAMILFAVIDIIGSIPIIIDLRKHAGQIESGKATWVSFLIMVVFLFIGENILSIIGVDVESFAIAGAFVIFFLALEMILGIRIWRDQQPNSASIVPLAFPLIAGAGSLTTLLSLRAEFHVENIIVGVALNCLLVYGVLKGTGRIEKALGPTGMIVLRKAFGIILLAIAIKLFKSNIGL